VRSRAADVERSPLDEACFGVRTARASALTAERLAAVLGFCRSQRIELLIARCRTDDLAAAQAIETAGGQLMDTLIYYGRELARAPLPSDPMLASIRPVASTDADALSAIAREAFRGYHGHYHADPRLDDRACDEAYVSWTRRSCQSRAVASEILVCELDGAVAAFATMRMNSPEEGEGMLTGVAPWAQGKGVYRGLIVKGLVWCQAQGAARMVLSTQITNLAVQKVWVRLGFEPRSSYYTFHKWFDRT